MITDMRDEFDANELRQIDKQKHIKAVCNSRDAEDAKETHHRKPVKASRISIRDIEQKELK